MGSQKKKKEKRKDFVKAKLKVGKTKPKATSHTDLGFRAKAIDIRTQSISKTYTSRESFNHHLSLTRHHSHITRRESLAFIQSHLPEEIDSTLFTSISPLVLDPTQSVRSVLLSLLRAIPITSLAPHIHLLSLYIHSGMTHLSPEIRSDSSKFLTLILKAEDVNIPIQLVTRSWAKTLTCLCSLLGWDLASVQSSDKAKNKIGHATSIDGIPNASGHLEALSLFLRLGLLPDHSSPDSKADGGRPAYHADTAKHLIPRHTSSPFSRLGLLNAKNGALVLSTEDIGARFQILEPMLGGILAGLESGRREGGEIGRTCKHLIDFLEKVRIDTAKMQ